MVRSRYCGPARPRTIYKKWLQEGFNADSWSYNQSEEPEIYLRPRPNPDPVAAFYSYIDEQGYPYDLESGNTAVDLELNPTDTFYDLNG